MYKLAVLFSVVALAVAKPSVVAPVAYSAAVPAVSSVSQYSNSVVHGAPVVAPAVYSAPVVAPALVSAVAPAVVPAVAAVAQAPHSPAVVLDAVNGVPLDTPEVVAARVAHYQTKALSAVHHLGKRSATLAYNSIVAPVAHSAVVAPVAPVVSTYSLPAVVSSQYAYSAVVPKALSVHPW